MGITPNELLTEVCGGEETVRNQFTGNDEGQHTPRPAYSLNHFNHHKGPGV
jgi:hypothetical protein